MLVLLLALRSERSALSGAFLKSDSSREATETNLQDRRRVFMSHVAFRCSALCRRTGLFLSVLCDFIFEMLPNVAFSSRRAASIKGEIKTKRFVC